MCSKVSFIGFFVKYSSSWRFEFFFVVLLWFLYSKTVCKKRTLEFLLNLSLRAPPANVAPWPLPGFNQYSFLSSWSYTKRYLDEEVGFLDSSVFGKHADGTFAVLAYQPNPTTTFFSILSSPLSGRSVYQAPSSSNCKWYAAYHVLSNFLQIENFDMNIKYEKGNLVWLNNAFDNFKYNFVMATFQSILLGISDEYKSLILYNNGIYIK